MIRHETEKDECGKRRKRKQTVAHSVEKVRRALVVRRVEKETGTYSADMCMCNESMPSLKRAALRKERS